MTAQHTPGPHHVRTSIRLAGGMPEDGPMYVHDVVTEEGETVCQIDAVDGRGEADALLHAAAPLMLDALREALLDHSCNYNGCWHHDAHEVIRAATGEDA